MLEAPSLQPDSESTIHLHILLTGFYLSSETDPVVSSLREAQEHLNLSMSGSPGLPHLTTPVCNICCPSTCSLPP